MRAPALLALCLGGVHAVVHEKIATVPHGWKPLGNGDASSQSMTLSIGLKQQNLEQLESRLYAVSTPGHADYGKHLEGHHVDALVRPSTVAHEAILEWLGREGVTEIRSDGAWVTFGTFVGAANKVFFNGLVAESRTDSVKRRC